MAKRTRKRPLRIGDPVPPDQVEFLETFRRMPSPCQRAAIDATNSMPPGATGDEKVRRVCLAIAGHPRAEVDAIIVQERRASFRAV